MYYYLRIENAEGYVFCMFFWSLLVLLQFNDALMYTTPVQSGQYKLNSVLSLAGMKVRDTLRRSSVFFYLSRFTFI